MKVLMIGPDRKVKGGVSSVVNQYYEAGLDKDLELTYLPSAIEGYKILKILFFVKALVRFRRLVQSQDIVYIHMASNGSYMRKRFFVRLAKQWNKRVIIHIHGGMFAEFFQKAGGFIQKDIRTTLLLADKVIVLAEPLKKGIAAICGDKRITVLHNAVHVPPEKVRDYADHRVLFLGLITGRKGIYDLLRAWKGVVSSLPDAVLYVGGNGEIDRAQKLCRELEITDHVCFLGWIRDQEKEAYLESCSVFILPSYVEAMPMSVLEAMAHGLATVATAVGGVPSVIRDGEDGVLLAPGCPEQIQKLLCSLLPDERRKVELGRNGYARVRTEFNLDLEKGKLIDLLKTLA